MTDDLVAKVAAILVRADPIRIYFPEHHNSDEYDSEARHIAERLADCSTHDACLEAIYDVFIQSFGSRIAGSRERYEGIATLIWTLRGSCR